MENKLRTYDVAYDITLRHNNCCPDYTTWKPQERKL